MFIVNSGPLIRTIDWLILCYQCALIRIAADASSVVKKNPKAPRNTRTLTLDSITQLGCPLDWAKK